MRLKLITGGALFLFAFAFALSFSLTSTTAVADQCTFCNCVGLCPCPFDWFNGTLNNGVCRPNCKLPFGGCFNDCPNFGGPAC